jgi:type VI protein secretion system component Hcp
MLLGPVDRNGDIDKKRALKGRSTDKDHFHWIQLDSCSFTRVDRAFGAGGGGGTNRERSSGTVQELFCSRAMDGISAQLMKLNTQGTSAVWGAIIDFVKDGEVVQQIDLENVLISSYQASRFQGKSVENFVLNFNNLIPKKIVESDIDRVP